MKKSINFISGKEVSAIILLRPAAIATVIVAVLAAIYFGPVNSWLKYSHEKAMLKDAESEVILAKAKTSEYEKIREEYLTYSAAYLSETEASFCDRRLVLDTIEKYLLREGKILRLMLEGNEVITEVIGLDMSQVSELCGRMDKETNGSILFSQTKSAKGAEDGEESIILRIIFNKT